MTGAEFITEVRSLLDAPAGVDEYYEDTEILSWGNLEYKAMANDNNCIHTRTNILFSAGSYANEVKTVANQCEYALPSNFGKVYGKRGCWWNNGTTKKLVKGFETKQADEEGWLSALTTSAARPLYYEVDYLQTGTNVNVAVIQLYPYPDTSNLRYLELYYIPKVTDVTTATSFVLKDHWLKPLIYRVVAKGKLKRQLADEANNYLMLAEKEERSIRSELQDDTPDTADFPTKPWMRYSR